MSRGSAAGGAGNGGAGAPEQMTDAPRSFQASEISSYDSDQASYVRKLPRRSVVPAIRTLLPCVVHQ